MSIYIAAGDILSALLKAEKSHFWVFACHLSLINSILSHSTGKTKLLVLNYNHEKT